MLYSLGKGFTWIVIKLFFYHIGFASWQSFPTVVITLGQVISLVSLKLPYCVFYLIHCFYYWLENIGIDCLNMDFFWETRVFLIWLFNHYYSYLINLITWLKTCLFVQLGPKFPNTNPATERERDLRMNKIGRHCS